MKRYKLIREYPGSPKLNTILTHKELQYCNWDEYYEEIVEKDYEILEIRGKYGAISSFIEKLDSDLKDKVIFKIKRLSDGETFTIGDKYNNKYIIKSFGLIENNKHCMVYSKESFETESDGEYNINNIFHSKQPLFTTEDGVDIFEGDEFYSTRKDCSGSILKYNGNCLEIASTKCEEFVDFSTKEKAEEYILMNKPCLSINEILSLTKGFRNKEHLKKLVQQKLNK